MAKSGKKKIPKVLLVLGILLAATLVFYGAVWFTSDRIIKISFNGLDNMFVVRDEYYAVSGPFRVPVTKGMVQSYCDKDLENIGGLDKEVGRKYFVQVCWSENGRPFFEGTTTLIHSFDSKYVFEVTNPGPDKCEVSREEERVMLDVASHFYDFSAPYVRGVDNWVATCGKFHTTMFSYTIHFNGDDVLFELHRPGKPYEIYSYKNSSFIKVMNVPSKGDYQFVIWKKRAA